MKILLDEYVFHDLRSLLGMHSVFTVAHMKWNGTRNGELLALAAQNDFEAVLTFDRAIPHQQNLHKLPVAVVLM